MSIDVNELKQMLQQQLKLMDALTTRLAETSTTDNVGRVPNPDSLLASVTEFLFDPATNVTFDAWYTRYEDLFNIDLASQDDGWKVRQLLRKLGPAEYRRYANFILPKQPRDVNFTDTIGTLKRIFGECTSLFNARYQCLQLTKKDADDFITYAGIVNQECARFKLGSLTEDQFKCLIFICGLRSPKDADIRTRLLTRVQQDPNLTLQQVAEECQNMLNLKHDSAMIQQRSSSPNTIHAVTTTRFHSVSGSNQPRQQTQRNAPPSACHHCGAWHFHRDCHFRNHRCQRCKQVGHKDGFCQPQSPTTQTSKPKRRYRRQTNRPNTQKSPKPKRRFGKSTARKPTHKSLSLHASFQVNSLKLRQFVTLFINGHQARLQLDTASDITIISHHLWKSLGSPPVHPSTKKATSACGGSVQLTGQLHCSVSFRGTTIDATCYVSNVGLNLLGLDWLQQLGLLDLPISAICNQVRSTTPCKALSDKIETMVKSCSSCQQAAKAPPRQAPIPWQQPKGPWSRVHLDFAGPINGVTYLVAVDAFSKWPEIVPLTTATSFATIASLRRMFSQHGLPDILVTDNGTQFASAQFSDFCRRHCIEHIRTPPYHPQSNGQAERFVDTFKRALLKFRGEGTTEEILQAFLFAYRTTPNAATPEGNTPAEALMGRKLRTIHHALIPIAQTAPHETETSVQALPVGCPVYARDFRQGHGRWAEGIISAHRGKVMFEVSVNGKTWIRHRNQIRPRQECATSESNYPQLPLDILLDTFDIPHPPSPPEQQVQPTIDASLLSCRRSERIRRPTRLIQIDPRAKHYR